MSEMIIKSLIQSQMLISARQFRLSKLGRLNVLGLCTDSLGQPTLVDGQRKPSGVLLGGELEEPVALVSRGHTHDI